MQQEVKEHPESYIERNKIYLDVAPKQRQGQSRNESYNRHSLSDTHNRHSMGDMHNINQALMAIDSYKIHDVFK